MQWGKWERPFESLPDAIQFPNFAAIREAFLQAVKEVCFSYFLAISYMLEATYRSDREDSGAFLGYSHLLLLPLCVCDEEAIWKCQSLGVYSSIRGLMWSLRWTCAQLEMIWSETMEESFFAEFFSIPRPNLVSIWIGMPQVFLLFGQLGVYN